MTSLIGLTTDAVAAHGWLIGPFPETQIWQPDLLARADSRAIGAAWPTLVTVVALAVLGVVLNATGIEFGSRP